MKKIFFLAATLLCTLSSFASLNYLEPTATWTVGDVATLDANKWNSVTTKGYAVVGDWYVFSCYDLYKATKEKQTWISYTASGSSTATWNANGIFQGESYYEDTPDGKTCCTRSDRIYSYKVTNASALSLYCKANAAEQTITVEVYDGTTLAASAMTSTQGDTILNIKNLDKTKTYVVAVGGSGATDGKQNSYIYEIAFSISGEEPVIEAKATAPVFSVKAGEYFEAFKLGMEASNVDAIYYRVNEAGDFAVYTDSIEISDFENPTIVEAYATKEGAANSDTVKAEYKLSHFTPRTVFNARTVIAFGGLKAEDAIILDPKMAVTSSCTMDNEEVPSVDYKTAKNFDGTQDSTMDVSFKGKESVHFVYKNKDNKANIMKCAKNYLQLDGSGFEMRLSDLQAGDTIVFVVTSKGSKSPIFSHTYSSTANLDAYEPEDEEDPDYTDGEIYTKSDARVDNDFCGYTNLVYIVKEGKTTAKLKETTGGFRLAKILIGAYRGEAPEHQAISNVNAAAKAVKVVENGQLVIIKNGVKYNALGAQL